MGGVGGDEALAWLAGRAAAGLLPAWLPLSPGVSALDDDGLLGGHEWLLDGQEAASGRWSAQHRAHPASAAEPPAPLPAAVLWRCLDHGHAATCTRRVPDIVERARQRTTDASTRSCEPAPAPADAGRYRLTDAAGQLAEKRLRALLSRCPEWNDAGVRQRLAAALEAEEAASGLCSGAVQLLRSHSSAHMRKHAMLRLAHCWRYQGDCWSERHSCGERKRSRKPAAAASDDDDVTAPSGKRLALSDAAVALSDRTLTVSQAAQAQVHGMLGPHIVAAARAWTGPLSATQYGRIRGEGMSWLRVRSIEGAHEVSVWLRDVVTQRLHGLRSWRATLDAETLRQPAFLCEHAFSAPDSELEALRHIQKHGRASTEDAAARLRQPDGGLLPEHAAWVQDYCNGQSAVLALVACANAFVASQRTQSLRSFLDAADAVLDGIVAYTSATIEALCQRYLWTAEAAAAQGPAAGCRRASRAMLPPLVQRLRLTGDDPNGAQLLALASTPPPLGSPLPRFLFV